MSSFSTEQELFWAGEFGDEYVRRNRGERLIAGNTVLFARILSSTEGVKSVMEFGANIGLNIAALRNLLPDGDLSALEINQSAVKELSKLQGVKVYGQSILDFSPDYPRDLVFTKGVLIHIDPARLPDIYDRLYRTCGKYLCVIEYYNPEPVELLYRGHRGKLFKRDFAGEILDRFSDLRLRDYGFAYRRDPVLEQDDQTWFLLEKR
jgi:spore coat polysaccharide biosynthesis protein SpsF